MKGVPDPEKVGKLSSLFWETPQFFWETSQPALELAPLS